MRRKVGERPILKQLVATDGGHRHLTIFHYFATAQCTSWTNMQPVGHIITGGH